MIRHCPLCGAPVERRAPPGDERLRAVCPACGHVHYENPKVVVGTVCLAAGERVLLCRRAIEPRRGLWTIPAGFLELGETLEEGARREAFEEARVHPALEGLLALFSLPHIGQVQAMFLGRLEEAVAEPGPETEEVDFFDFAKIPWEELAFPTVRRVLEIARDRRHLRPLVPVLAREDRGIG